MAEQLGLDLPSTPALGRENFFIAPSNAFALSLVEAWPNWPNGKLVLFGPEGSGKSHLVHVWAAKSGAEIVEARDLPKADLPSLAQGPIAIENVSEIAGNGEAEDALFHLHNLALAANHSLLMTGRAPVAQWALQLPDLKSRVQAATSAELAPPDDTLLAALLGKLCTDHQLRPKPDVIPYLVRRMERSFASAQQLVTQLDRVSLAQRRPITRQLASDVLADLSASAP